MRKKVKDLLEILDSVFLEINTKWDDSEISRKKDKWEIILNHYTAQELEMSVLARNLPAPCRVGDLGSGQIELGTQ